MRLGSLRSSAHEAPCFILLLRAPCSAGESTRKTDLDESARREPSTCGSTVTIGERRQTCYEAKPVMRPRDFIAVLEDRRLPRSTATGERAELLRSLLVHLLFIDHDLDKRELQLLERVLPDTNVGDYVKSVAARKLDLERLAAVFTELDERRDIIKLAEHAAWGDEKLVLRERAVLDRLTEILGLVPPELDPG
jgi:hypothetical protein